MCMEVSKHKQNMERTAGSYLLCPSNGDWADYLDILPATYPNLVPCSNLPQTTDA